MEPQPLVSFIVPCYRLAGFVGECLTSILDQSWTRLEILVMDDCSPDETSEVVGGFADPRVRYVRNARNLGHLTNYNKGLGLARGGLIWLISADDRLRCRTAVEQLVAVMRRNPQAAFAFSTAMGLQDGRETGIIPACSAGDTPFVADGARFLRTLLQRNVIASPAALARKRCYDRAGGFPLDLPYAGDWYLWCRFALEGRVAYVPEPLVSYRLHAGSMTAVLAAERVHQIVGDEIAVRWRIMHTAAASRRRSVAREAATAIADDYAQRLLLRASGRSSGMSDAEVERSLASHAADTGELGEMRARVLAARADAALSAGDAAAARRMYAGALGEAPLASIRAKHLLLALGTSGGVLRRGGAALRDALRRTGRGSPRAEAVRP